MTNTIFGATLFGLAVQEQAARSELPAAVLMVLGLGIAAVVTLFCCALAYDLIRWRNHDGD